MPNNPLGLVESSPNFNDEEFVSLLRDLEKEDLSNIVSRVAKDNGIAESEAEDAKASFLRFISLVKVSNHSISPDKKTDAFWHGFLIHTRQYDEFCKRHFGHFIHHEPIEKDANDLRAAETSRQLWENFEAVACCNNTCDADWPTISA